MISPNLIEIRSVVSNSPSQSIRPTETNVLDPAVIISAIRFRFLHIDMRVSFYLNL